MNLRSQSGQVLRQSLALVKVATTRIHRHHEQVAIATALMRPRTGLLYVRVNAADTEFCCGDLVAVVQPGLDGIILPKVESPATLATIDWLLRQIERERGLKEAAIDLIPIIETARGLRGINAILASATER